MPERVYTIKLEIRDVPGGLVRVAQVFSRRGCNIDSIDVARLEGTPWSAMNIVAQVKQIEQMVSQLEKLIDVHKVDFK